MTRIERSQTPPAPAGMPRQVATPALVFVISRIGLFLIAGFASQVLPSKNKYPSLLPASDPLARLGPWARNWFRFDARWYVDVAEHGYHLSTPAASNTNFFPLYPLLIRALQPLTLGSPWLAAWLIANAAFAASLIIIWLWAYRRWDHTVALRTVLLLSVFPFGVFFAAPYAESLFLALAAGAFLLADERRWTGAIVVASLSGITRPVGLAVIVAIVLYALVAEGKKQAAIAALSLMPFLALVCYLWIDTGDPLAFTIFHSAGWVSPHGGVTATLGSQFHTQLSPFDRIDAAASLLFLASAIVVYRRIGPGYGLFVALGVLLPLLHGLVSMERYVSVLFPVFAVWALVGRASVQVGFFTISLFFLILFTMLYAAGYAVF